MPRREIVVAVASDDAFLLGAITTMFSVVRSTPDSSLTFVLLDCGLEARSRERLMSVVDTWGSSVTLRIERVSTRALGTLPLSELYSPATYARLFLPNLLPDVDRVLYLDSDVLARRSATDAACVSLGVDQVCAAAVDATCPTIEIGLVPGSWADQRSGSAPYFNAGVLVMDLESWRAEALSERLYDFLVHGGWENRFADQDALNAILGPRFVALPPGTNYQLSREPGTHKTKISGLARNASFLHFIGAKPWQTHGLVVDATRLWAVREWYRCLGESGALSRAETRAMWAATASGQARRVVRKLRGQPASAMS